MDRKDSHTHREWNRLVKDAYHTLEFRVTLHFLRKYLPARGTILDAGGGPGRYTLELCRTGYDVLLLDIDAAHIRFAEQKISTEPIPVRNRLLAAQVGDIRDLSALHTNTFDAVLCLGGPLTYISDGTERHQALSELVRVAKPGAIIAVSVVGYLAMLRTVLSRHTEVLITPKYWELIKTGTGDNYVRDKLWHFFRTYELRELAETCGLTTLEMVGCEGLSTGLAEATNETATDPRKWERWLEIVLATATEPAVVDMAEHILYIGRVA